MTQPNSKMSFTGWVGLLAVSSLRNAVEQLRFSGYDIELWVGRGVFTRPFCVKGDHRAVEQVMRWMNVVNQTATA